MLASKTLNYNLYAIQFIIELGFPFKENIKKHTKEYQNNLMYLPIL